jgi:hypothetical protein
MRRRAFRLARIGTQSRDLISEAGRSKKTKWTRSRASSPLIPVSARRIYGARHWPKNTPTRGDCVCRKVADMLGTWPVLAGPLGKGW